jgi:hypothetical protein
MTTEAGKRLLDDMTATKAGWRLAIDHPELAWDIAAIEAEARDAALAETAERVRSRMAAIAGVPHDHGHTDACTACLRDGVLRAVLAILGER